MAEVILENVTKIFEKNVVAVKDFNVEIRDGEFMVLVGPSGCGKTTALRLIAGLEELTTGNIYIGDRLVNDIPPKDRDIAMVFQNYALYPHMNVYKNMAFGLKLRKYPKEEIRKRVNDAADLLGITEFLDRKPKALSGGQRQRVALGRAIVRKPRVFLFDEPLSNLDAKLRVQMRTEISKLHFRLGTTMVYVTHDQVEAMTMGDRIVVMKDGIIHQIDSPLNLYNNPADLFVAGFIGSPSMNFFDGIIENTEGLFFNEGSFRIEIKDEKKEKLKDYTGKQVIFGIRPENILMSDSQDSPNTVNALVEVAETMGNEIFLYLTTGKNSFVSRVSANLKVKENDRIYITFQIEKSHFFDKISNKVI